jgi:carotenoid cleavage dioxygenase-like enzyme
MPSSRTALFTGLATGLLQITSTVSHRETPLVPSDNFPKLFETISAEFENVGLDVTYGAFPDWVSGEWLKTGFCGFEQPAVGGEPHPDPKFKFTILFDTLGCAYRFQVKDGKPRFWAKYIKSDYYNQSLESIPLYKIFQDTDPAPSWWEKSQMLLQTANADNLNVNMILLQSPEEDHIISVSDVGGEMEYDTDTMETKGLYHFDDEFSQNGFNRLSCAHPSKIADDPATYNILFNFNPMNSFDEDNDYKPFAYNFIRFNPNVRGENQDMRRELVASVPSDSFPYMHHFAHTPNYVVLVQFPWYWHLDRLLMTTTLRGGKALVWEPEKKVRCVIVNTKDKRHVKTVVLDDYEAFFAFHHVNAYEDPASGDIVMDIATYDDIDYHIEAFVLNGHHGNNTFDLDPGTLRRIRLPIDDREGAPTVINSEEPKSTRATITKQGDVDFELPIVNNNVRGRPYKYAYGHAKSATTTHTKNCISGAECGGTWWDTVVKVDVDSGEQLHWRKDDHWPGEPTFIPRPGATAEDDGILLNVILGPESSTLMALDAKTFEVVAEAKIPTHIPYQSHGNWYPYQEASKAAPGYPSFKAGADVRSKTKVPVFGDPTIIDMNGAKASNEL